MHILIPSYTFPTDREPTENAIAYVAYIGADMWDFSSGRIVVWLYRSYAIANLVPSKPPADQIEVRPGEVFVAGVEAEPEAEPPVEAVAEVRMPTVLEIDAAAHAAASSYPDLTPMQLLGMVIYASLLNHPRLAGSTLAV